MSLINENLIDLSLGANDKQDSLIKLVNIIANEKRIEDKDLFLRDVLEREKEISTGMGNGIAIPHAKSKAVKEPTLVFAKNQQAIDYGSIDKKPVSLFFMIAVPEKGADVHLKILQKLSRSLMDQEFVDSLKIATKKEEILEILNKCFTTEKENKILNSKLNIVAIANCPAGVAHTYMVAESLEKKAKELNINIKVETQGASGIENKLTASDIEKADYVILALGKGLEKTVKNQFIGKKVLTIKISEALKNIDGIFENLETESKIFAGSKTKLGKQETKEDSIMEHLMSGVSAALPFVIGGGLLVALANILIQFGFTYSTIEEGHASFSYILETIGYMGFSAMIPIMGAYIAYSIADKPGFAPAFIVSFLANDKDLLGTDAGAGFLGAMFFGLAIGYFVRYFKRIKLPKVIQPLLTFTIIPFITMFIFGIATYYVLGPLMGGLMGAMLNFLNNMPPQLMIPTAFLVGAMLAFDMGGPINKTAWLFAFSLLDQGVYTWYGIVGVVTVMPPIAAGISTYLRPRLFSESERESALSAIVVGATVATEPAIPYALSSPVAMISANVISGGIAGAFSVILGVQRIAPGLGIFDPLLGLITPWYSYYLVVTVGIILNIILIIIFRGYAMRERKK